MQRAQNARAHAYSNVPTRSEARERAGLRDSRRASERASTQRSDSTCTLLLHVAVSAAAPASLELCVVEAVASGIVEIALGAARGASDCAAPAVDELPSEGESAATGGEEHCADSVCALSFIERPSEGLGEEAEADSCSGGQVGLDSTNCVGGVLSSFTTDPEFIDSNNYVIID